MNSMYRPFYKTKMSCKSIANSSPANIMSLFFHWIFPLQVLVGAHAVLANGGVICACGINMVALAARKHSVPFVVLVGLHKLSPLFPHDPDLAFNGEWEKMYPRTHPLVH